MAPANRRARKLASVFAAICIAATCSRADQNQRPQILGDESFTFHSNGSFLQIDAGREWPFNSKRELSFKFRTKSPHGLLVYQTFDHQKLAREDDPLDQLANPDQLVPPPPPPSQPLPPPEQQQQVVESPLGRLPSKRNVAAAAANDDLSEAARHSLATSATITATASEKLVNSLFSSSPSAAINGNNFASGRSVATAAAAAVPAKQFEAPKERRHKLRQSVRSAAASGLAADGAQDTRQAGQQAGLGPQRPQEAGQQPAVLLSSSTISSLSASLYELYLKLENGRLKIMYEFGSRLNQTYCGKGLNDDRWHRVELRVDPEVNQMQLVLDQTITVEIVLSPSVSGGGSGGLAPLAASAGGGGGSAGGQTGVVSSATGSGGDEPSRNELVFTNSVLYLGGLNNNATIVRNVRQRLYLAQFIGCIGQILLKTSEQQLSFGGEQQNPVPLQPALIDRAILVKRGCVNLCETNNYCLHNSTCVNYYTTTKCDCFGTSYEDTYCWQDKLSTLSMFGYSTLVYRIYDWRDRHHSSANRLSLRFRTRAKSAILFFAYGDLSQQQLGKQAASVPPGGGGGGGGSASVATGTGSGAGVPVPLPAFQRPQGPLNNNYLAVSLSNGSIVVEVNFGDQPLLLTNLLYEKFGHVMGSSLADGNWHSLTFLHANKLISLQVDGQQISHTILGKNNYLYFDPSVYLGAVPNFLLNETRALLRPLNLRHKFVGCLQSVYFNQHNILLALEQSSQMAEFRDPLGKPHLDATCHFPEVSSLPITLRSGKSYLTFQLSTASSSKAAGSVQSAQTPPAGGNDTIAAALPAGANQRKATQIEFEYKTSMQRYFLAGGNLRDLSYHDLGGFWTLYARENCQLYFTLSSGLSGDPEQVLKLNSSTSCANSTTATPIWQRVFISIVSGEKVLNITRTRVKDDHDDDELGSSNTSLAAERGSHLLEWSVELMHQVQLGGDLLKFGESTSIPFSGCLRRIKINGNSFDARDFVSPSSTSASSGNSLPPPPPLALPLPFAGLQVGNLTHHHHQVGLSAGQHDFVSSHVAQGHVSIDSCKLVNSCLPQTNPCKNNGLCKLNDLGEPDCDCSKTGYTGKRCHFSIYKKSCRELYLAGHRKSSHYLIDLDRNGPLKPIRVRCNMQETLANSINSAPQLIETSLSHNLPTEFLIRRSQTLDLALDITYFAYHHLYTYDGFYMQNEEDEAAQLNQDLMLQSLIGQSLYCKQYFRFECRSAQLNLGSSIWMEVPFPRRHKLVSFDKSGAFGRCACASSEKKCLDQKLGCNCDSAEPIWADDSVELIGKHQVGITKIVLLKQEDDHYLLTAGNDRYKQQVQMIKSGEQPTSFSGTESQTRITLSDLKCYAQKETSSSRVKQPTEITFKTSDAFIEVPGWLRGDISFSFRTASSAPAIILYQLATSRNHGYFRLTLISDSRLLFEFVINRRPRKLHLSSAQKLNNGDWQQVFIEYDSANLRLVVNDDSVLLDLDSQDHLGTFEGPLFIGGAPSKYLVGDLSKRNGFTGCFKGLYIANRLIDLNSYLSPSMPSVISGCQPSCRNNLCQNGGKCIEYWGSYECECSNPIAHSGINCEINLNTNSLTFITQESYYVQTFDDTTAYPAYLLKNILLNIRTYQETALVLYAYDRLNNFVQLHKNGSSLVFTFNSNATIVAVKVPIEDDTLEGRNEIGRAQAAEILPPSPLAASSSPQPVGQLEAPAGGQVSSSPGSTGNNATSKQQPLAPAAAAPLATSQQLATASQQVFSAGSPFKVSNTSGSGQPIQVKIERQRLRTTFYVNNNFIVVEKPINFLTNYSHLPWQNQEAELVRPNRPKTQLAAGKTLTSRLFLANIDEHFTTRLPGFTGCIQGLSIDNQLFDFNRAHLAGKFKGDYKIGCKMHCDSLPCKNSGVCIENWLEDKIQCKCDATSYIGEFCDEDIAATFSARSASYFVYYLSKFFEHQQAARQDKQQTVNSTSSSASGKLQVEQLDGSASAVGATRRQRVDPVQSLEISLAFSSEPTSGPAELANSGGGGPVQVLVFLTVANSSKRFFLGLTSDGSLLIQEDFGNSMSLSRLLKNQNQLPYNDNFRHMVRYSRHDQDIKIVVDHQTYLPTMNVITTGHDEAGRFSRESLIAIGTVVDSLASPTASPGGGALGVGQSARQQNSNNNFANFSGCISNLVIEVNGVKIEPLSEAFGQHFEPAIASLNKSNLTPSSKSRDSVDLATNLATNLRELAEQPRQTKPDEDDFVSLSSVQTNSNEGDDGDSTERKLDLISKEANAAEFEPKMGIVARNVAQGNCAPFRRVATQVSDEKRPANEPKGSNTQFVDPRPVYMDPPRARPYKRSAFEDRRLGAARASNKLPAYLFYCSLGFLIVVSVLILLHVYRLQVRYRSEQFRCDTPFFHKRDNSDGGKASTTGTERGSLGVSRRKKTAQKRRKLPSSSD